MRPDRNDQPDQANRVALVTGGSGALGGAVCRALDRAGYRVAIHYCQGEGAARAVQGQCANPSLVRRADIADWDEVVGMVDQVGEQLGPIGVVVNCAAVRRDGLLATQGRDEWEQTIQVNLLGTFNTCRAVVPQMLVARWGRIVNVVSPVASASNPGQTAYAASKAGVVALTRTLAMECGRRGVTVNAVSPGYMDSAMVAALPQSARDEIVARSALRRAVEPSEVADAVRFLVENPAVTGAVLPVDAGVAL